VYRSLHTLLHTRNRGLFEKITFAPLVNIYVVFYGRGKAHYRIHSGSPLVPALWYINIIHNIISCLLKIHFNIILFLLLSFQYSLFRI
jgi:hypothetical protein